MSKSWRPEGWEKIKQGILPLRFESLDPEPFKLIEAGADAMLKILREHHTTLLTEVSPNPVKFVGCKLVIIPDDEAEE